MNTREHSRSLAATVSGDPEDSRVKPEVSADEPPRTAPRRLRISAVAALALFVGGLTLAAMWGVMADRESGAGQVVTLPSTAALPSASASGEPSDAGMDGAGTDAYVHILGQVRAPGLYAVAAGSRVIDVVGAAGGVTSAADMSAINLARIVSDGEQLYVPAEGETPPAADGGTGAASSGLASTNGVININVATAGELEQLPRVGPALAQRIIDWRDAHGQFTAVEDLLSVSGIGEKTLDGFRAMVTV